MAQNICVGVPMRKHTWKVVSPTAPLAPTMAPGRSPVLHVPAVLGEPVRVALLGVAPYQGVNQLRVLELEAEGCVPEGLAD